MTKNIIIAGASRSGKTTLSLMLQKKGFTYYKMDSLKRAIYEIFTDEDSHDWQKVSPKMAKFINYIINDDSLDTNRDKNFYLFDICPLYPQDLKYINLSNTIVIYLGYRDISIEEELSYMKKYNDNYWYSNFNDDELKRLIKRNIDFSYKIAKECEKYGIKYYDTGKNRKKVLKSIYEELIKKSE